MKKLLLGILLIAFLTSCTKKTDDFAVKDNVEESKALEAMETTGRPIASIKVHDELEETMIVIPVEESMEEETTEETNESLETTIAEEVTVEVSVEKETKIDENFVKLTTYNNKSSEKKVSTTAPAEQNAIVLSSWGYGMTPLEWIFVEPNNQLISNNKPNSSQLFAYKNGTSSGSKGCFIAVFSRCDSLGSDYEGRVYCTDDYTKSAPEEMLWANKFTDMVYEGHRVIDILADKYEISENDGHMAKVGNTYVNVVYVSELDEILGK